MSNSHYFNRNRPEAGDRLRPFTLAPAVSTKRLTGRRLADQEMNLRIQDKLASIMEQAIDVARR